MKLKLPAFFIIIFSIFGFSLLFPSRIMACTSNADCASDEFCYVQSGICSKKTNAPQTKDLTGYTKDFTKGFVTPQGDCGPDKVNTAIGCISTSIEGGENSFFGSVLKVAVGLGGGLALLLMLYGVFIVTTSAGIPDKLKEGQEIITSAVSGLIFIILSVFLLNLIGINILGIPGLQ